MARKDEAPKRMTLIVRPRFLPSQLASVTLKLPEDAVPEEGEASP
jgi:hypothetical protein